MRLLSIATWTSGEPVSPSAVLYSEMISVFWAVSSAMISLLFTGIARARGVEQAAGRWASQTAGSPGGVFQPYQQARATRVSGCGQQGSRLFDVVVDLLDQRRQV